MEERERRKVCVCGCLCPACAYVRVRRDAELHANHLLTVRACTCMLRVSGLNVCKYFKSLSVTCHMLKDRETFFYESLRKWQELNCTQHFGKNVSHLTG